MLDTSAHAKIVPLTGDNANGKPSAFPSALALIAPTPAPGSSVPTRLATPIPGGHPGHSGELETAEISDRKAHSSRFPYLPPEASIAHATRVLPCFT